MEHKTKLLIIGSGPAGCSAALYAARANLAPIMVAGHEPGGQLMMTTDVENYPGFVEAVQGPDLMNIMIKQAERFGTQVIHDKIDDVDVSSRPFRLKGKHDYIADAVIIATGAQAKWLGIESEQRLRGLGVSGCATCDGFFFKSKDVAVVGGGNAAVEEAIFLTRYASKVTLIHRRDSLRAEKIMQDKLFANPKISVVWNSIVKEVLGKDSVQGIVTENVLTKEVGKIDVSGVFIAIGHKPNTDIFKGKVEMDGEGYIVPHGTSTSVAGIFAAGDVQDKVYRQAVTAAGSGCAAALDVIKFLEKSA